MAKDSSAKVFRLKWDNHLQNLSCLFESLYVQQKYVDVSLYCDGGTLKAHKVVLSACSIYFEKIFKDHPCKHPVVIVNDIKLKEMQMVLEYMYKGELNVIEDELNSFVSVASLLEVRGLSNNLPKDSSVSSEPSLPASSSNESNGMEIFNCQTDGLEIMPVNTNNFNDNHNMAGEDDSIMDDRQSTPLSFTDVLQDMLGRQSSMEYTTTRTPDNHTQYRQRRSNETLTTSSPENKRVMRVKEEYVAPASPLEILEISENPLNNPKEDASTEEKSVECGVCKLTFMTASLLQAHLQDDHNYTEDYRPHRCDFCPLAFYRSAHLKRHRRLHTGEKPFACELCGKSFSRQDKLKQHVTRHGPQVIPVPVPRGRTGRPPRSIVNPRSRQTSRPSPMPNRAPFGDVSYLSSMSLASQRSDSISAEQLLRSVQDLGECIIQPCLPNRH